MRNAIKSLPIRHLGIRFDHSVGIDALEWANGGNEKQVDLKDRFLGKLSELSPDTAGYGAYLGDLRKALGEPIEVRFPGPLAVGLGQGHLLVQGLTLHWLFGVPMIHGSAVKGVCLREALIQCGLLGAADRAAKRSQGGILDFERLIQDLLDEGQEAQARQAEALRQVFGDPGGAGRVRFHDALWVPDNKPPLAVDVTNPHNQKWYMPDKQRPLPDDTQPPIPVKNLVVRPGSRFYFWIVPEFDEWRDQLRNLLLSALLNLGVGAKTNVGYGAGVRAESPSSGGGPASAGATKTEAHFQGGTQVKGAFVLRDKSPYLQLSDGGRLAIANPSGDWKPGDRLNALRKGNEVWITGKA